MSVLLPNTGALTPDDLRRGAVLDVLYEWKTETIGIDEACARLADIFSSDWIDRVARGESCA